MRAVIDACQALVEILAASIKSSDEAISVLLSGAHHMTLPLSVIQEMLEHQLSQQAIEEFAQVHQTFP